MNLAKSSILLSLVLAFCCSSLSSSAKQFSIGSDTIHLNDPDTLIGFEILDTVASKYHVFISGENHTYLESNSKLWVQSIKYLHGAANMRNVMIEYGYASGWLINQYVQTGDTSLRSILKSYSFKEYADAYESLYQFNKGLADDEKIRIVGIDLERGLYSATKVLSLQLPDDKEPHDDIALDVESLRSLVSYNDNEIFDGDDEYDYYNSYSVRNTMERVRKNFDKHPKLYQEFLGENYTLFGRILGGFKDYQTWKDYESDNSTHQFVYREKYMFDRFKEEYATTAGSYFGQFGRCHSAKSTQEQNSCNWYHFNSLASRIENSKELKLGSKVMTLGILYGSDKYEEDGWQGVQVHIDSLFNELPKNSVKLHDLKADSSLNSKLEEYFDYIILNSNKPDKEHPYISTLVDDDVIESEDKSDMKISFNFQLMPIDLSELNNVLAGIDPSLSFNDMNYFIGFSTQTTNDDHPALVSTFNFNWMIKQKDNYQEQLNRLEGFFMSSTTRYDILSKIDAFDVMPGLGFGYSNLTLAMTQPNPSTNPDLSNGFLGNERHIRYTNPAFTIILSNQFDIDIKKFTMSLLGGYQFDVSKKRWIAENLLNNGPRTSFQTWFAQFSLGFNFYTGD